MIKDEKAMRETMTSRQRVIHSIEHKPIDRVPIDLGAHFSTGISAFAYWNLREYLGMSTKEIEIIDPVQFLARVDDDILERFHCDCKLVNPPFVETQRWNPRGVYEFTIPKTMNPKLDERGNWVVERNNQKMRMPKGGYFFDGGWPSFYGEEFMSLAAKNAEQIYKETDYFTLIMGLPGFFSMDPDFLCTMLTDTEEILEQNQKALERGIQYATNVIRNLGHHIQGIEINGDLGMQNGPACNPDIYAELCAPFLKKMCDFVHENSDYKIFMHSCGSIKPFIPMFIECGVDIVNPVQISADNMRPQELKGKFGDQITFWGGGCNTQQVLNLGTPEDVVENVKMLMNTFKPGSGFVFNQVHNIMGDIKPENIVAMLDTAYAESFYEK